MIWTVINERTGDRATATSQENAEEARRILRNEGVDQGVSPRYVPIIIITKEES